MNLPKLKAYLRVEFKGFTDYPVFPNDKTIVRFDNLQFQAGSRPHQNSVAIQTYALDDNSACTSQFYADGVQCSNYFAYCEDENPLVITI
jgi:hypothetical protein